MNPSAAMNSGSAHPLSGLEGWPKTGPVYGFAEDDMSLRSPSFWQRLGDRLRRTPSGDGAPMPQARIWY